LVLDSVLPFGLTPILSKWSPFSGCSSI